MSVTSDENEYTIFINLHRAQLALSGVPEHFWSALHLKLSTENFDSGNTFQLTQIEFDEEQDSIYQLQVKTEAIRANDPTQIYLIDHAWTFRVDQAKQMLAAASYKQLLHRMANLMGVNVNLPKEQLVDGVFNEMWRFANTYSVANAENVEDRMPVWYIMDEVGSAMRHSDTPNFRMVPFFYNPQNITYSLIFPVRDCGFTEVVTRNFLEKETSVDERQALLLPWVYTDLTQKSFQHIKVSPDYFLSGHIKESLPILSNLQENCEKRDNKLKVYSQYKFIHEYLTDEHFELVGDEDQADILWYTSHFKKFEELSNMSGGGKFVNQFPFEYILTIKDLLCIVCRFRNNQKQKQEDINSETFEANPRWLPCTFNLSTEIAQFVSYFQNRQVQQLDNHWIIKPFNLARGLDTHITNNINYILRLPSSGPKIAQKYIENPVLFERETIGKVKFDIRYVLLLKTVKPLTIYLYKNFFLRFANQPFSLDDLHVYEKHFTVMNYTEQAELKHMLCDEFKVQWDQQFAHSHCHEWDEVELAIRQMLREVFECATTEAPPCGIAESPQSRALYAADIMLEYKYSNGENRKVEIVPKLLEINWMPDCKRACEYYPDFYNDIFKLLFLDVENDDVFSKL